MMKRSFLAALFYLILFPVVALAEYSLGLNFRDTDDYVVDEVNETYVLGEDDAFPTERAGAEFGWVSIGGDAGRDRDDALDRRIAGVNQAANSGTQAVFRETLPEPGIYTVCLALGDAGFGQDYQYAEILDDTTSLIVINDSGGTDEDHFNDASGTDRTTAAWPGSQTCVDVAFYTTNLVMKLGSPTAQTGSSTIAHLGVTYVGPAPLDVQEFIGFEVGDQSETSASSGVSAPTNFSTTTVRSGVYALKLIPTTSSVPYVEITCRSVSGSTSTCSLATVKITTWINPEVAPSATEQIFSIADSGTAPGVDKFSLRMDSSRHILGYGSGASPTLLNTGTTVISLNTWTRLEITVGTGTSANYEVKIGGVTEFSGTANLGTVNTGRIRFGKFTNRASSAYTIHWDDITTSVNSYLANSKIKRVAINGDASPVTWTTGTNDHTFLELTEIVRDEDTTYLQCASSSGAKQNTFTLQDTSELSLSGKIKALSATARVKEDGAGGTSAFVLRFIAGLLTSDTTNKDLSTSYSGLKKILVEDPNGGDWTYEDLDELQLAIIENNAIADRCTQIFGMVLYNPDESYDVNPYPPLRRRSQGY